MATSGKLWSMDYVIGCDKQTDKSPMWICQLILLYLKASRLYPSLDKHTRKYIVKK